MGAGLGGQETQLYGELLFLGAGCTNDGGRIEVPADTAVIYTEGLAVNAGLITLSGGAFDNCGHDMTNAPAGQINGHGTFRAGVLTNNGAVRTANQAADIMAKVVNNGWVEVINNTTTFFGDFENNPGAVLKNTDGTIRVLGTLTNNGLLESDPADNYLGDVSNGPAGYLVGGLGDRFLVSGDFASASDQSAKWNTEQASLVFRAGGDGSHLLGVTGADLGPSAAGWEDNFAWGVLRIEAGQVVRLVDGNADPGGALYLGRLALAGAGAWLDAGGLNVYYGGAGAPRELFYGDER